MKEWAEKEIEIACKRERNGNETPEGEWDYGCACYQSALKAFNSLIEDGHSGFSISLTKNILNRLIEGKPLTGIEDTDDVWYEVGCVLGFGRLLRFWRWSRGGKMYTRTEGLNTMM